MGVGDGVVWIRVELAVMLAVVEVCNWAQCGIGDRHWVSGTEWSGLGWYLASCRTVEPCNWAQCGIGDRHWVLGRSGLDSGGIGRRVGRWRCVIGHSIELGMGIGCWGRNCLEGGGIRRRVGRWRYVIGLSVELGMGLGCRGRNCLEGVELGVVSDGGGV